MKIFDFLDYKKYVLKELERRPNKGHGQFLKISKALSVHTTMITHVFKGDLHLSAEQTLALADFLGLSELETEYFANTVQFARAGDQRTKSYYQKKISELKHKALNLSARLETKNTLDEKDQAVFYSSWIYSAVRLLSAVPKFQSRVAIAEELNLPQAKINKILEFLLNRGLCVEVKNKIFYGDVRTYVGHDSPLVGRHHTNWRFKAIEHLENLPVTELAYTNPVVISEKDYEKIREELVRFIETFKKISEPSSSEKLCCLNIDWIQIRR